MWSDERGRRHTVAQIAETFAVSRKTVYRNLERGP
ncbi:helix-turn-helix domain-containing protein [Nocardia barduliensis]|nr:helix-turn-helix domain-containing protein [Nocardia barduliensis]